MSDETAIDEAEVKEILASVTVQIPKERKNKVTGEIVDKTDKPINEVESQTRDLMAEFGAIVEKEIDLVEESGNKLTIPTGIDLLDAILGGGFAIGALNIIVGQPGSGKTMVAVQAMAGGQQKFKEKDGKAGLLSFFLDSEEATTPIRLHNLGVNTSLTKIYPQITIEKVFKVIEGLALFKINNNIVDVPSMIVWDSIANTLTQKEMETDDINSVIGYKARMLSILIPKYVAKCAQNNICLVAVNQLRDVLSLGRFAPPKDLKLMSSDKDMPGGNILKYNAFHLIEMKIKTVIAKEKADQYGFEGVIVNVKCVKNKLFPPNVEVEIVGSFTNGFSNFWTNYNFLKETKRLTAGAWNYLVSTPDIKFRTKDAEIIYNTNEIFKQAFDTAAREAIQTELVEKYNQLTAKNPSNANMELEQN
jgi:RecA/RadA recombinase